MSEAEQQPRIETELQNEVSPSVARFLAGKDFFSVTPHQLSVPQENELFQMIATQTENDLERALIDDRAGKSRAAHWKKEAMRDETLYHFANRNERFNQQVGNEFVSTLDAQQLEESDSDLSKTLTAIGLRPDMLKSRKAYTFTKDGKQLEETSADDSAKTVELNEGVESFRQKYFDNDTTSKATEFVIDIAATCKKEDGSIDVAKLRTQLHSVGKLLEVFGKKEDHIDILMEDFIIAYGLSSQKEATVKKALARETVRQLRNPITNEQERVAYMQLPQEKNYVGFQLRRAQEEALTPNLIEEVKEQQDAINKKFQDGEITDQQRKEEFDGILNSKKGVIETHSIEELKALFTELEKHGVNKETLQNTLKHEQTHFDKVIEIGELLGKDLSPRIIVQLGKGADGKFTYQPRTVWNFNDVPDLDDVTRREINEDVIAAPGFNDLSKSDEKVLGLEVTDNELQEMKTLMEKRGLSAEAGNVSKSDLKKLAIVKLQQQFEIKQRYRKYKGTTLPTNLVDIPHGEYETPPRIIDSSLVTSGNVLKALGVYQKDLHSQEALGLALQADKTEGDRSAKFMNVIQKQTSESNITLEHPTTLTDALRAIEEGEAAIIYLQEGQATIEPGQKVYQNSNGEFFIQVISPEGETRGIPLSLIIDNSFQVAVSEERAMIAIKPPILLFKKNE